MNPLPPHHGSPVGPVDRNRIEWVDCAKGIGIILVVLGHAIRGLFGPEILAETGPWAIVDRWIYTFHMPLFFLLSGLFLARAADRPFGTFLQSRAGTIVYPYFLWSILQGWLQVAAGQKTASVQWQEMIGLWHTPVMQFWFLYVLFLGMLLLVALRKLRLPLGMIVLLSVGFLLTTGTVAMGPWGVLYQLRTFLPYLALGMLMGGWDWHMRIATLPTSVLGLLMAGGFGVVTGSLVLPPSEGSLILTITLSLNGVIGCIALAALLSRAPRVGWLILCGIKSLEIFVAHTIFSAATRIGLLKIFDAHSPALHVIAGTVVGVVGPMVLAAICKRAGIKGVFNLDLSNGKKQTTTRISTP